MSSTTREHSTAGRQRRRTARYERAAAIAAVAGVAAALAPASITGQPVIDALQRALVAAVVTFIAAHGHRWSWFVAGAVAALPARGFGLLLIVLGLVAAVLSTSVRRRSVELGALAGGLVANGICWYRDVDPLVLGPICAAIAICLFIGSGYGEMRRRHRRIAVRAFALAALIMLVGVAAAAFAGVTSMGDLRSGTEAARRALAAVRDGDTDTAQREIATAQDHLAGADERLSGPLAAPAKLVPGLAQQVDAVQVSVDEALAVSGAAADLVATDYDSLRYNGRIDLAEIESLVPRSVSVEATLTASTERLDELRDGWLAPPLRDRIDEFAEEVADAQADATLANEVLSVAPGLLGADGPRTYLVAFMTPAELRGAGGFIGNFAELRATDGDVSLGRSGRIRELLAARPDGARTIEGLDEYLDRYGRFEPADNVQDASISPHWPYDAQALAQLYPQSGGSEVDAVIGIDPTGMAALLELTGPVEIEGLSVPLSAENAEDYLTRVQYLAFGDDTERREDILDEVIRTTFDELTTAELPAPRRLGAVLGPVARGRHIHAWSPEEDEQALFALMDASGELDFAAGGDGLAVIQQNAGNNKLDAYLQRDIDYTSSVDTDTGDVESTLTITLHNAPPDADLPRVVDGNNRGVPRGTNLTWLNLHTPLTVTSATLDGDEIRLGEDTEAGMPVWETPLLQVPPGGSVTLEVRLRGAIDLREAYRLTLMPQPVANPDQVSVRIDLTDGDLTGEHTADGAVELDQVLDETVQVEAGIRR